MRSTRRTFLRAAAAAPLAGCFGNRGCAATEKSGTFQTTILDAGVQFADQSLLRPLIISLGAITEITEAVVEVTVRVEGKEATGRGSIYLSDLWAWSDPTSSHPHRDAVLRKLCEGIGANLWERCGGEAIHPLELGLRLHENVCRESSPPILARAMCASPFDAAIHAAVGTAMGCIAFDYYRSGTVIPSADSNRLSEHFRHP